MLLTDTLCWIFTGRCISSVKVIPEDGGNVGVLLVWLEVLLPCGLVADGALRLNDTRALQFPKNATPVPSQLRISYRCIANHHFSI
jgi:hypothetical protein